jgi:hypothetical protein
MGEPRFQRSGEVLAIKRKIQDALSELYTGKGEMARGPLNEMILVVQEAREGEGKLKEGGEQSSTPRPTTHLKYPSLLSRKSQTSSPFFIQS